jgi:amidase
MFRSGPPHAEGLALTEKALFAVQKAGATVIDPVLLGMNLHRVRMLKVNYWEQQTILDKYFADFGPRAPFRTVREMVARFPEEVNASFKEYLDYSPGADPEYQSRLKGRRALREAVVALMDQFALDAVVFPYKTITARGGSVEDPINRVVRDGDRVSPSDNYLSSMTGLPSIVMPMGYTDAGIPLSLEFLGRPFAEPLLIKLASGFEAQTQFRKPPASVPPLPGEQFVY